MNVQELSSYINSLEYQSTAVAQTNNSSTTNTSSSETDSYISSITSSDEILSSDTYNDILSVIKSNLTSEASNNANEDEDSASILLTEDAGEAEESVEKSSGNSSGESEEVEDETKTEIITMADGTKYLQITSTENGVETVKRIKISAGQEPADKPQNDPTNPENSELVSTLNI